MPVSNPGTGPIELGYAQITANFGPFSTIADVTGLSVPVVVRNRPILIAVNVAFIGHATQFGLSVLHITDSANTEIAKCGGSIPVAAGFIPIGTFTARLSVAPGSYTYKVRADTGGGNGTLYAGVTFPAWISVREV